MNNHDIGKLFDEIVFYYPSYKFQIEADPLGCISRWHKILSNTPLTFAIEQLEAYVSKRENKYAPHPGMLAKTTSDSDRYHDHLKSSGAVTLEEWENMRKAAVGPTDEQRRKVREMLERTN